MSPAGDGTQLLQRATAYDSVGRSIQRCSALARCAGASTPTKPCLLHSGCPMTLASWSEDNKSKATWPAKRLSKVLPAVSGEPSIETSDPELRDALEILKDLGGCDRAHLSTKRSPGPATTRRRGCSPNAPRGRACRQTPTPNPRTPMAATADDPPGGGVRNLPHVRPAVADPSNMSCL